MTTRDQIYTVEEFLAFAALPEHAEQRFELHDGVIEEMPPSSPVNSALAIAIGSILREFVRKAKLGFVTGTDGGYQIAPNKVYQPDVAYTSRMRLPSIKGITIIPMAPDLAVEIVSPSESDRKVMRKAKDYLHGGAKLVWGVYPDEKEVDVHRLTANGGIETNTINIDGEAVLPGLKIALKDIFDAAE